MHKHFKYEIRGCDWCYKLIDMTSKDNLDDFEFQWILPAEYLMDATPEAWKRGLLTQFSVRVQDDKLSAIGMRFNNGGEKSLQSPIFGEKDKIDRKYNFDDRITRLDFTFAKNLH